MGRRGKRGLGTAYEDTSGNRKKKWAAERWLRLPNGQKVRVRVRAESQTAAIELLDARIAEVTKAGLATSAGTLNDMLDRWLTWLKPTLRASSFLDYEAAMRLYVRDAIGPLQAKRITTNHISDVIADIMGRGHMATAHKVKRLLSQAFIWAVKRGLVTSNPVAGLDSLRRPQRDPEAWTPQQLDRFLRAAAGHPYYALYYTAASTSMRKGELLALRWTEVQGDSILVKRTTSKGAPGGVTEGAKTSEGVRRVPISRGLARVLAEQRVAAAGSPLVFPGRGGMISGSSVSKHMRRIIEIAKVPSIRFHDLRKTSASLLARSGVPPAVIQARLGHANPELALKVYTKVFEEDARRATVELGGHRGGLPPERRYTGRNASAVGPKARRSDGRGFSRRTRKRRKGRAPVS